MSDLDFQIQETTIALLNLVALGFGRDVDLTELPMDWYEEERDRT